MFRHTHSLLNDSQTRVAGYLLFMPSAYTLLRLAGVCKFVRYMYRDGSRQEVGL